MRKSAQGRPEFGEPVRATIVGVVGNVRHYSLDTDFVPEVYLPYTVTVWGWMSLVVRTVGDPAALVPAVTRAARSVEPDLPLEGATFSNRVYDLPTSLQQSLAYRRFITGLLGAFALPAVVLAALGIFGVVAYLVTQRSREIGIRMALGAQRGNVLALVLAEAMRLTGGRGPARHPGAIATTRWLSSELYEISATDPLTFVLAALTLVGVSLCATAHSRAAGHGDRPGSHAPVGMTSIAMPLPPPIPGFRPVPFTGVIFVMAEAGALGYRYGHPDWCNLGQGQPETGPLPGAPPRVHQIEIGVDDQDYAPVPGIWELRRAVAELYNRLYRGGKGSRYTERNVCICGGGRSSLTRAVAALGQVNLGHFLPDYTAYEELLDIFKLFTSIPILLDGRERLPLQPRAPPRGDYRTRTLGGAAVEPLQPHRARHRRWRSSAGWVEVARELGCSLLVDEFYSHYVWRETEDGDGLVSAARYVDDVDADPVVLFDGLTKNWRYPGWRCSWIVGPQQVIEAVSSSGSFLDGGGSKPLQRSAVPLLEPTRGRGGDPGHPGGVPAEAGAHGRRGCGRRGYGSTWSPRGRSTGGATSPVCRRRSTTGCRSSGRRSSGR